MRYPRAFILFNHPQELPEEDFFQSISGSKRKIYLSGISKPIKSIDNAINCIRTVDCRLTENEFMPDVLVISNLSVVDFVYAYISDKKPRVYWVDSFQDELNIRKYLDAFLHLEDMKYFLRESLPFYCKSRRILEKVCQNKIHDPERYIMEYQALAYGDIRTTVESEIRVHLKNLLSFGVLNRLDLNLSKPTSLHST